MLESTPGVSVVGSMQVWVEGGGGLRGQGDLEPQRGEGQVAVPLCTMYAYMVIMITLGDPTSQYGKLNIFDNFCVHAPI